MVVECLYYFVCFLYISLLRVSSPFVVKCPGEKLSGTEQIFEVFSYLPSLADLIVSAYN